MKTPILDLQMPAKTKTVSEACSSRSTAANSPALTDVPSRSGSSCGSGDATEPDATPESRAADIARKIDFGVVDLEARAQAADSIAPERLYWEGFFVNLPMFCGYAALFGLQHEIKSKLAISDDDVDATRAFGIACSFLYIFNLIFRFSHNVVFGFLGPRGRAFMAMLSMMASMLVIAGPIFILEFTSINWVVLAYGLGGVAVGTFEANFLCCLTPLGHETKHVAITAIPVGITTVLVGGFFAMGPPLSVSATGIYVAVAVGIGLGMLIFAVCIPHINATSQPGLRQFIAEARQWREWLPLIWHLPVATAIDMFTLSAFSPGLALYIWDQKTVEVMPGFVVPTHTFFAIYNTCNMFGGITGRVLSYKLKPRHPVLYSLFNLFGAFLILQKIPILAPLSTFIVMMGDGLIYGSITRRIDATVPKEFNLIALSFWLFVGDFGSVLGSNLISYMRQWVGA